MKKQPKRSYGSGGFRSHPFKPGIYQYIAKWTNSDGVSTRISSAYCPGKDEAIKNWNQKVEELNAKSNGVIIYDWDNETVIDLCLHYAANDLTQSGNTFGRERKPTTKSRDVDETKRIARFYPKLKVKDMTIEHAEQLRFKLETTSTINNRNYAPKTISATMKFLKRVLQWAYLEKMISVYPFEGITNGKTALLFYSRRSSEEVVFFTRQEVRMLCAPDTEWEIRNYHKTRNTGYYRDQNKLWVELSFVTGSRIGESTGLQWKNISWGDPDTQYDDPQYQQRTFVEYENQWTSLGYYDVTKTSDSVRDLPIPWPTHEKLLHHYEIAKLKAKQEGHDEAWLLEQPVLKNEAGKAMSHNALRLWIRRRCDNVGIERKSPHALRRGFATERAEQGVTPDELTMMLGHAKGSTTALKYYTNTRTPAYKRRIQMAMVRTEPVDAI